MKKYQEYIKNLTEDFAGISSVQAMGQPLANSVEEGQATDDPFSKENAPVLNLYTNGDGFKINDNSKLYEVVKLFTDLTSKHLFIQNVSFAIDVNNKSIAFNLVTETDHVLATDVLKSFVDTLKQQITKRFGNSFDFEVLNKDGSDILGDLNNGGQGNWQGKKELLFVVKEKGSKKVEDKKETVKESVKYKVDFSKIKNKPEQYLKLLKKEIRQGNGFVEINSEDEKDAEVYAANTNNQFLGTIRVSKDALIKESVENETIEVDMSKSDGIKNYNELKAKGYVRLWSGNGKICMKAPVVKKTVKESIQVEDYKIIDHGIESEQYFRGCGTSGTPYDTCFTGIGESAYEALEDALEQAAESDYDIDNVKNVLSKELIEREEENDGNTENHYYVSILLKKKEDLDEDYIAKSFRMFREKLEEQDTIIQGYIPTITNSKEKLFIAFSPGKNAIIGSSFPGELTKDYLEGYLVSSKKRALDIAKRYISNSGYDGIPGADAVNGKNEIIKESKAKQITDEDISKIPYTIKDFDITQDKPKDAIYFNQLKDKLIYSFESKDGNISANIFWTNPEGKRGSKGNYNGKYVNLEMRGMVGKYGTLLSNYPLWTTGDKIPSINEMINSVIKSVKRKEY